MKQILPIIALTMGCAGGINAETQSYDFEENGLFFSIINQETDEVEIVCGNPGERMTTRGLWSPSCDQWPGNSYSGDVVVPSSVSYLGKEYTVTGVGLGCFVNCAELTSVVIPETVVSVADEAFSRCPELAKVTLPDGISEMGRLVFSNATSLTELEWPASQKSIPDQTFENTGSSANKFTLTGYENVEYIGDYSFIGCPIKAIDLSENANLRAGFAALSAETLEELILPTEWNGADYTVFLRSLLTGCSGLKKLTIYAEVPPTADDDTFAADSPIYTNAVLEVPETSVEAYKAASFWKNFRMIEATSVDGVSADDNSEYVDVYTTDGIRVKKHVSRGEAIRGLTPGVYIIDGKKVLIP